MTDWKLLAEARHLDILDEELAKIRPVMDTLEAAFLPMAASIPLLTEPATVFNPAPASDHDEDLS